MEYRLTEEKFKTLLKGLKATYPQDWFIPNEAAANVWYRHLMDIPYEALSAAISAYIMTEKKEPTIAAIREKAKQYIPTEKELGEQEAWAMIRKAVRNSNYHAQEEFDKLPEVLQKAVGNPANLAEWAAMDLDTFESVQQSQFLRSFRVVKERKKEVQLLSPALQAKLSEVSAKLTAKETKSLEQKGGSDDNT